MLNLQEIKLENFSKNKVLANTTAFIFNFSRLCYETQH